MKKETYCLSCRKILKILLQELLEINTIGQ